MSLSPESTAAVQALLLQRREQPFAWGTRDCAWLAFDAARAITGTDPAPDLRGAYTTARQARRILARLGGMVAVAAARFGAEVLSVADVRCGDVVLVRGLCPDPDELAFGLVWRGQIVAQGPEGLVTVPPASVQRAWRPA